MTRPKIAVSALVACSLACFAWMGCSTTVGIAAGALVVSPAAGAFGTLTQGPNTVDVVFRATNNDSQGVTTVSSVTFGAGTDAGYSFSPTPGMPVTLQPLAANSLQIVVRYDASAAPVGINTGTIEIVHSAAGSPAIVNLSVLVLAAPSVTITDIGASEYTAVRARHRVTVTVDNSGGSSFTLASGDLLFTDTTLNDADADYTVTPVNGYPTAVAANSSRVLDFNVNVAATPTFTAGPITVSSRFVISGTPYEGGSTQWRFVTVAAQPPGLPVARRFGALSTSAAGMHYLGGFGPPPLAEVPQDGIYDYDGAWTTDPAVIPFPRHWMSHARIGNVMYLLGGGDLDLLTFSTDVFTWDGTTLANVGSTVGVQMYAAAATDGTYIYMFGGYDHNVALSKVERYDPATNTSTIVGNLPGTPYKAAAGYSATNNKFYIVGGSDSVANRWNGTDTVYEYDPVTDTGVNLTATQSIRLAFPTTSMAFAQKGRSLLLAGGRNAANNASLDTIQLFDVDNLVTTNLSAPSGGVRLSGVVYQAAGAIFQGDFFIAGGDVDPAGGGIAGTRVDRITLP